MDLLKEQLLMLRKRAVKGEKILTKEINDVFNLEGNSFAHKKAKSLIGKSIFRYEVIENEDLDTLMIYIDKLLVFLSF